MRNIEITTAHNIVVSHELASVGQRIVATTIDGLIVYLYAMLILLVVGESSLLFFILIVPVAWLYHLLFELYNEGQSIGKRLLKIRVVSIEGMAPSPEDYFMRWIFRTIDVTMTFGALAMLTASTSSKNQRFGDIMARTTVISLKSSRQFDLEKIRNLDTDDSQIMYPGIAQYSDSDMLLVKQTLMRHQKSPNQATREIIIGLRDRIVEDLSLDIKAVKEIRATKFLKQILQEYILLTR